MLEVNQEEFLHENGMTFEKAQKVVRERLESVNFNAKVLEEELSWVDFIEGMLWHPDALGEWAEDTDLSDEYHANCFVMYLTTY